MTCEGNVDATGGPIPPNIESLFPNIFDVSTWNLAPLSGISRTWRQVFAPSVAAFTSVIPRYSTGAWAQDDWAISPRLTLNVGVRYDLELNAFSNDTKLVPFWNGHPPNDKHNVQPRLGFTFTRNDRTVIRGGGGLYVGTMEDPHYMTLAEHTVLLALSNDGRPDFASNPYNGPPPTWDQIQARLCTPALVPGCIRNEISSTSGGGLTVTRDFTMPYAYQSSIGLQRQLGATMALDADYVYTGTRDHPRDVPINLSFNPATGANYPFSDISRRPFPDWGFVGMSHNGARSNRHALQTAFTKRLSHAWQASVTYTLAGQRDAYPPQRSGFDLVPFPLAPDFASEYSLSVGDQRHRATVSGLWQLRYGFQLSGLYFYGSGERFTTNWGTDVRNIGSASAVFGDQRVRPDGTIIPRNNLVGDPVHRVDLRLQRRFSLGGRAGIDGLVEVFNVFNHANYGSYNTTQVSRTFGQPTQNDNLSYSPRTLQLGFRLAF